MICITSATNVKIDYPNVVARSPIRAMPKAPEQLKRFVEHASFCYVGMVDGLIVCVYGIVSPSLLSDRAYLWMLTTDEVDEHRFLFIRHSQRVVESVLEKYSYIIGDTSIGDKKSLRWLKWLGAEFGFPQEGTLPFTITRKTFGMRKWIR